MPVVPQRLRGWKAWLTLAFLALVGTGAIAWWCFDRWVEDTSDLAPVIARAHHEACPTTWAESGLAVAPAARQQIWREIVAQQPKLLSWEDSVMRKHQSFPGIRTGSPLPPALIAHHAGLDEVAMQRPDPSQESACADAQQDDRPQKCRARP